MDTLDRAMLHFREATYHYNKASKILLELAEAERDRLRRTYDTVGQTQKTDLASNAEARLDNSQGTEPTSPDRAKVVDIELRRERARAGIPTELRDII